MVAVLHTSFDFIYQQSTVVDLKKRVKKLILDLFGLIGRVCRVCADSSKRVLIFLLDFLGGKWSKWTAFTPCDTICGKGKRTRMRTCSEGLCAGPNKTENVCERSPCKYNCYNF